MRYSYQVDASGLRVTPACTEQPAQVDAVRQAGGARALAGGGTAPQGLAAILAHPKCRQQSEPEAGLRISGITDGEVIQGDDWV